jgi:hypothetical protein
MYVQHFELVVLRLNDTAEKIDAAWQTFVKEWERKPITLKNKTETTYQS